jgi:hypothetical protein
MSKDALRPIKSYLQDAVVGSVKLIAIRDAVELRTHKLELSLYQYTLQQILSGEILTVEARNARLETESELRMAETMVALAALEINRNGSRLFGYTPEIANCESMLVDYETQEFKKVSSDNLASKSVSLNVCLRALETISGLITDAESK